MKWMNERMTDDDLVCTAALSFFTGGNMDTSLVAIKHVKEIVLK